MTAQSGQSLSSSSVPVASGEFPKVVDGGLSMRSVMGIGGRMGELGVKVKWMNAEDPDRQPSKHGVGSLTPVASAAGCGGVLGPTCMAGRRQ